MSRHRIVRSMDYNDEYDGYDDVYGHSVDDDNSCISPTDAQQWLYDRARGQQSMSAFIAKHRDIEEEDEEEADGKKRRDSEHDFQMPLLGETDQVRLLSCVDEIRSVIGETISEKRIIETILKNNFDCTASLDEILNDTTTAAASSSRIPAAGAQQPAIEKDLNTVQNLTDLIKQKCVPSSSSSSISSMSSAKFILPNRNQIFGGKPQLPAAQISPTFSKLSDLANFHLRRSSSDAVVDTATVAVANLSISPKFIIPKLVGPFSATTTNSNSVLLTPHELSLRKKIRDLKTIVSPMVPVSDLSTIDDFVIDLSSALRHGDTVPIMAPVKSAPNEEFVPQFIDCDLDVTSSTTISRCRPMPVVTADCEIDSSPILAMRFVGMAKRRSQFGKILCTKYSCRPAPIVSHEFRRKHTIEPFWFGRPSPDDIVMSQLKLNLSSR